MYYISLQILCIIPSRIHNTNNANYCIPSKKINNTNKNLSAINKLTTFTIIITIITIGIVIIIISIIYRSYQHHYHGVNREDNVCNTSLNISRNLNLCTSLGSTTACSFHSFYKNNRIDNEYL